ncbi:tetratricopeptide repeat-containing sensor histidine kinase [Spirosoma pollinicola]|uniref:histidine kinase n=1 Tax=Spirosoma pollinicola TaxID=2057025 RepID=A0A2K8Z156_9BACT|nr:histidine kinase dimerization/phosphoacceptor domain -containing protein [Spirosoma pollinicola]AUD03613.1 histidine kinase [Spirosoma pollinicola]
MTNWVSLFRRTHTLADRRLSSVICLCLLGITCQFLISLPAAGQNITRKMVNQLLIKVQPGQADTAQLGALIELGKFHVYKAGEVTVDLDSAIGYLKQAEALSTKLHVSTEKHRAESLLVIAYMERGDRQLAQYLFVKLVDDCKRTGDAETEADARYRFAVAQRYITRNYPEAVSGYRQAAALYKALDKPEREIKLYEEIAGLHADLGELELAESELLDVLKRYKAIKYTRLHYTYAWLAGVSRLKGNFDKGLLYALKSLESMNRTQDTLSAASFYGTIAEIYMELGKQDQSIYWFKKTLQQWRQEKLPNYSLYYAASLIVQDLIGHHKTKEGLRLITNLVREISPVTNIQKGCIFQTLAYCYDDLKNYSQAETYYLESISWYDRSGNDFEMSQKVKVDAGRFYLKRNDLKKASFYLRKALAYNPQKNALSTIKDIHFMLFKVDSTEGNYLSAIDHFRQHKALNDSIFSVVKSRQLAVLEVRYATAKRVQQIQSQQRELAREKTTRNGILAGSALLLGLLGVSYNQYRLKQRSNKLLEAKQLEINRQNKSLQHIVDEKELLILDKDNLLDEKEGLLEEKEWMLKEIHHRVKNNLQIITSLLHSQGVYLKDKAALSAIRESQNRVHIMALIHQKLYQSDQLSTIPITEYIDEIVDYLLVTFARQRSVTKKITIAPINLDVLLAVPLGLILNEVVTNSLKYAFPDNRNGCIQIDLSVVADKTYRLTISDNGVGFPPDLNPNRSRTLGMSLIRGLSKQIGGKLQIHQTDGVQISLTFTEEKVGQADLANA